MGSFKAIFFRTIRNNKRTTKKYLHMNQGKAYIAAGFFLHIIHYINAMCVYAIALWSDISSFRSEQQKNTYVYILIMVPWLDREMVSSIWDLGHAHSNTFILTIPFASFHFLCHLISSSSSNYVCVNIGPFFKYINNWWIPSTLCAKKSTKFKGQKIQSF